MTATLSPPMSSRRPELFFRSRAVRWLLPTALLALTPKCLLCVLAYVGLGAALGIGGTEMCGAATGSMVSWASALAWLGLTSAIGIFGLFARHRKAGTTLPPNGEKTERCPHALRLGRVRLPGHK